MGNANIIIDRGNVLQHSKYNKSSVWVPVSLFVSEHVTAIRPMFFPVSEFFTKFLYFASIFL